MKAIDYKDIEIKGELAYRTLLNYSRLQSKWYRPETIFENDQNGWPGDWEGRTILALTLLSQSTKCVPAFLDGILAELSEKLNEKGYLGRILEKDLFDEQQLSGHSWLLRGLIEYYNWKKDESIMKIIESIVDNLLLPTKGFYLKYPSRPEDRVFEGEAAGNLTQETVGNWFTSTDTGCAFIMLDGASHAYQLLKTPKLKELLDEMIQAFLALDLLSLSVQTHATLSASRGILRYYEMVQEPYLLEVVEKIFSLYIKEGITENYANYNWFGRPEWTEPCAVIDSFVLSVNLWKLTAKKDYIEYAHNILYNAIEYGQRPNGGFGCDACAGAKDEFLYVMKDTYEAYWCCTMRGGEGLSRAIESNYFIAENIITIPFYNDSIAQFSFNDGKVKIKQKTEYPINGNVKFEVLYSDSSGEKELKLFIPSWTKKESVEVSIDNSVIVDTPITDGFIRIRTAFKVGMVIRLCFDISINIQPTINKNSIQQYHTFRHGVLLLGIENPGEAVKLEIASAFQNLGNASYKNLANGLLLSPINNIIHNNETEIKGSRKQILFR